MSRAVRNLPIAREELVAAISWYEEQQSGLGGELYNCIDEAIALTNALAAVRCSCGSAAYLALIVSETTSQRSLEPGSLRSSMLSPQSTARTKSSDGGLKLTKSRRTAQYRGALAR